LDDVQYEIKDEIIYNDISKLLNKNELYLDFAKVENSYYYFTLDKQKNIQFKKIDKEQTKEINRYIKRIREDLDYAPLAITKKRYTKLYNLIFKDIDLKDKTSLIISPDGLLGLIPFEAFYDNQEQKYLIEKLKIRYIPSGKEFVKLHRDKSKTKSSDIVVFADVNFDRNSSKPQKRKGNIFESLTPNNRYLKYSKHDAMVVKKLFPNNTKLFLEENATEKNLLKLNAPKILYLSTHGIFIKDKSILNPMLKSIILLDGANESIRQKRGEGIVSGLELAGLNLHGTELVVLSACETGVGELENSEGVAGLGKAFMKAGAKNIIMTLWSVDDKNSALLMERFYEGVKNGHNYSDALREAKIWMIKEGRSHPFYWSGFVGSGRD
jgi:CHAT domain-containing protein